jgi:RHS repeat-associated protein
MEFQLPMGSYAGRGINLPLGLSYSSKVWRFQEDFTKTGRDNNPPTRIYNLGIYSADAAAGWTSSLAQPYIEYTGDFNRFDGSGRPLPGPLSTPFPAGNWYVQRLTVFLPNGESHELRRVDLGAGYYDAPFQLSTNGPPGPDVFGGLFVASDGSGLKYVQTYYPPEPFYRLYMPDGSFYDFSQTVENHGPPTNGDFDPQYIRKGIKLTDVNGNFVQFNDPDVEHGYPYGSWSDQLGRTFPIMVPPVTPQLDADGFSDSFTLPGMSAPYVLTWKRLDQAFGGSEELHYVGASDETADHQPYSPALFDSDIILQNACGQTTSRLFVSAFTLNSIKEDPWTKFGPLVLTDVQLPNGLSYQFKYNEFGEIEQIYHPTGAHEEFDYQQMPTLANMDPAYQQTNRGVNESRIYENESDAHPLVSTFSAAKSANNYRTSVIAPDGTQTDNFMHRGVAEPNCGQEWDETNYFNTRWGYDAILAGKTYETRVFSSGATPQLVQQTFTKWKFTNNTAVPMRLATPELYVQFNPRVDSVQSITYEGGSGVSAVTKFEYDDEDAHGSPLNVTAKNEYAYTAGTMASPAPSPGATPPSGVVVLLEPTTGALVRRTEMKYLINDTDYSSSVRDIYKCTNPLNPTFQCANILRRVTVTTVKDGSGVVVSRHQMVYDESGSSPGYVGDPTSSKVWDSNKGAYTSSSTYITTGATFDQWGNQTSTTDALGNTTTTTFDSTYHAFPVTVTGPTPEPSGTYGSNAPFVTHATFDPVTSLPLTTTDVNGLTSAIEYDSATLRPRYMRYYSGGTQSGDYFSGGTQIGGTNETVYYDEPNNAWVRTKNQIDGTHYSEAITYFDGLGRPWKTEKVDSHGNVFVNSEFDYQGRVKRVSNPYKLSDDECYQSSAITCWATNIYDTQGRIVEVDLPDGSSVHTAYGVSTSGTYGMTKTITDEAGKKRKGLSDSLGNTVQVTEDPDGAALVTNYTFDTLGNLRKTVQGDQSRYFYHSSLGRLLFAKQVEQDANTNFTATDPVTSWSQWSVKYVYDDNGNITQTTDANNVSINASYDHLNRIYFRDYSDSTPDVNFYYDGKGLGSVPAYSLGKTTKVWSSASETKYMSFDIFGRVLTHRQTTAYKDFDTAYTYNLGGALIEETYPSGRVVKNTVDENGDLEQVQSRRNSNFGYWQYASGFSRDSSGNVTKMQLGNGYWETASYNNRGQANQIGLGSTDSSTSLLKLEFKYDTSPTSHHNNGSMLEQKITVPQVGSNAGFIATESYTYDDLNRITSASEMVSTTQTWKQEFSYDRYGNKNFVTGTGHTTTLGSCPAAVCNPAFPTATATPNRNRFDDSQNYSYDHNGSITQNAAGERFHYDAENHQKEFFVATNNTSNPDATYVYDGDGKRIKKVSSTGTTIFIYDASSKLVAEYSPEPDEIAVEGEPHVYRVNYMTTDHLGSPRIVTDQDGAVVSRKDFGAFGDPVYSAQRVSGPEGNGYDIPEIRQDYTGHQKDEESGLEFAQARYYNSVHGRFTSVDPLAASAALDDPQTFNRYTYVLNSPYRLTDELGLFGWDLSNHGRSVTEMGGKGASRNVSDVQSEMASMLKKFDEMTKWFKEIDPNFGKNDIKTSGDYYDRGGNWLGTDEIGDGLIYLLNDCVVPNPNNTPAGKLDADRIKYLKDNSTVLTGLIIMDRQIEGSNFTTSQLSSVPGNKGVEGYMLEPAGPSTSQVGQDKRIPEEVYDISAYSSKKFPNNFIISNAVVPKSRKILIHSGNNGNNTEGCLIPGGTIGSGTVGQSKLKLNNIRNFINSRGVNNVKLIIKNSIP